MYYVCASRESADNFGTKNHAVLLVLIVSVGYNLYRYIVVKILIYFLYVVLSQGLVGNGYVKVVLVLFQQS